MCQQSSCTHTGKHDLVSIRRQCSCRVSPKPGGGLVNTDCCTPSPNFLVLWAWETHIQKYHCTVLLQNTSSCAQCTVRPNKLKSQSLEERKFYCRAMHGDGWLVPKKNPELLEGFQQSIFKDNVREGRDYLLHISFFWNLTQNHEDIGS